MKKVKFWALNLIYLLIVLAEGFFTYRKADELHDLQDVFMIYNPLVSNFGLHWIVVPILNVIVLFLLFSASYYSYFVYKTVYTNETKFTCYCSQIIYDKPDMFWKGLIPKHFKPYISVAGFSLLYAMILGKSVSVFEWLLYDSPTVWSSTYFALERKFCFGRLDIIVCSISILICYFYWFYKEYKKQLDSHEDACQEKSASKKKDFLTALLIFVLVAIILVLLWCRGIELYQDRVVQSGYGNGLNSANQYAKDVTMIELIANPEKYDGELVRVIGVGNLEFEGDCIGLSKEHLEWSVGTEIWIVLGERAIPYEEAKQYNGEYVIVEGIFDMDDRGHMGAFKGTIKDVSRYELLRRWHETAE